MRVRGIRYVTCQRAAEAVRQAMTAKCCGKRIRGFAMSPSFYKGFKEMTLKSVLKRNELLPGRARVGAGPGTAHAGGRGWEGLACAVFDAGLAVLQEQREVTGGSGTGEPQALGLEGL